MDRSPSTVLTNKTVLSQLTEHIRAEGLAPGDRLDSIRGLAVRLERRPHEVRDALLQAERNGLVEIRPRSGVFVRSREEALPAPPATGSPAPAAGRDEPNLFHVTEVRRLVEMETVRQAAARCRPEDLLPLSQALRTMDEAGADLAVLIEGDERFHLGIASMTGNDVFVTVLRDLLRLMRPFRETLAPAPESRERTRRHHRAIYRALHLNDSEAACVAMLEHLTLYYDQLVAEVNAVGLSRADAP